MTNETAPADLAFVIEAWTAIDDETKERNVKLAVSARCDCDIDDPMLGERGIE